MIQKYTCYTRLFTSDTKILFSQMHSNL